MNWKNRTYCGSLTLEETGKPVQLYGWIDTIRDHGQLLFTHLRDKSGVVQLVFDPTVNAQCYKTAETLRSEYVCSVVGTVTEREDSAKNTHLPTGSLEITVSEIEILSEAETPPFVLTEKSNVDEEDSTFNVDEDLRLKYRYLDLRRPSMQRMILERAKITKTIRDYFAEHGFVDVETPVLTKSTPEGARDYLVPSRHHQNTFYALPQSPQLFKQLLMVSGLDRYYQIVKCFRDEDLRPNRQPEFTQLDLEASFIDEAFIFELMEGLMVRLYALFGIELPTPFPHITYKDAMDQYGCDRPDLRFDMKLIAVQDLLTEVNFKVFQSIAQKGGLIKAINVKGEAANLSKSFLQEELAKKVIPSFGGRGMAWMKMEDGALNSNIVQFFSESEQAALIERLGAEDGDVLLFIADMDHALVNDVAGRLRLYMGDKLGFLDKTALATCWVTEFPLFEKKDGRYHAVHHPFTAPSEDILGIEGDDSLLELTSKGYDMVINGEEIGGGSIRIHRSDVQQRIFELLGLSEEEIDAKFGWFVKALQYGAPPHGGIALGVDRLTCLLLGTDNIREVIAFPKNRVAFCPLTQAPSPVDEDQLQELYLDLIPPVEAE